MDTENIIAALDQEIEKLQQARTMILHLGTAGEKARPSRMPRASSGTSKKPATRRLSPQARKRIADAQRKRWAKAKQAKKKASKSAGKKASRKAVKKTVARKTPKAGPKKAVPAAKQEAPATSSGS